MMLVGDDADRMPAEPRISADERLAILSLVLLKAAGIDQAVEQFSHFVLLLRIGWIDAENIASRSRWIGGLVAPKQITSQVFRQRRCKGTQSFDAGIVVDLMKIDRSA